MMDNTLFLLALLFFIEVAETTQYKGETFNQAINTLYHIYKERRVEFFMYHFSFFYVLYVSFEYDLLNFWTVTILLTKAADFSLKLYLFKKIDEGGYFTLETYGMPDMVLDWKIRYLSVIVYTGLFIPGFF